MSGKKTIQRLTAMMLSVIMVVGMMPVSAAAETSGLSIGASGKITVFEAMREEIASQSVPLGTSETDLELPDALTATIRLADLEEEPVLDSGEADAELDSTDTVSGSAIGVDDTDELETGGSEGDENASLSDAEEAGDSFEAEIMEKTVDSTEEITVSLPVTWVSSPEYDSEAADTYLFTPELPEGLSLAGGVVVPTITVTVGLTMRSALGITGTDCSWYDGNSTATEFEISSAAQLKGLADIVNGNHGSAFNFSGRKIILTSDIDLSEIGDWTPIGNSAKAFSGEFEGNSHTIGNLIINTPDADHVGLFGMIKGTVSNLILTDVNITGKENVGGIAGEVWGSLSHCAVIGGTVSGYSNIGGVAGRVAYDLSSGSWKIDRYVYVESRLESCFATSDILAVGESPSRAGGVAGSVEYGNLITCYATGSIMDPVVSHVLMDTLFNVGGIVGSATNASIINCYATGDIEGTMYIGGIVGTMSGDYNRPSELKNCAALNSLVAGYPDWFGGPQTGRVAGRLSPQYEDWSTLLTQNNFAFSGMTVTGDGALDGTGKATADFKYGNVFEPYGFTSPVWESESGTLPVLAGFPEGLQNAELPAHLVSDTPSRPQNLSAAHGDQRVTLSWKAPGVIGESAVIRYEVRKNSDGWISVGMSTSYAFTGLANGTTCIFYVRAVNSHGNGAEATIEKSPGAAPGAVKNFIDVVEGSKITLFWEPPAGTKESDGVYYETKFIYTSGDDPDWSAVEYGAYSRSYTPGFLSWYKLQIRAGNIYGAGPTFSFLRDFSIQPTSPQGFTAVRGDGQVALSWSAPQNSGGSAVVNYQVFHPVSKEWISVDMVTSYTITGLTNGQEYRFFVRASNSSSFGSSATLVTDPRKPPVIYTEDSFNLTYGTGGSFQVQAFGSEPLSFLLIGAPHGVTIENSGFMYIDSTIPAGSYTFTVKVSNDSVPDATQSFTLIVVPFTPSYGHLQITPVTDRFYDGTATGIGPVTDKRGLGLNITVYYEGADGTVYAKSTTPPQNIGSYWVTASIAGSANINATSFPLAFYSILPKPVTVTPVSGQNKIYGQADSALQYTLSPALATGEFLTGTLIRTAGENIGAYDILPGTLTSGSNYALTFTDGICFTVEPKSNAVFTITDIPAQTYTDSAFTPEPEVRDGSTLLAKGTDFTYSYEDNLNAGASAIVRITGMGNYAGSTGFVTFTIGKANNTLNIPCDDSTYGETFLPVVETNTGGGAVSYEYKLQGEDDSAYTPAVPAVAGSYTVRGTSVATANYNAATATANFTIGKADNTLIISCANITYGQILSPQVDTSISGGTVSYEYKVQGSDDSTYTSPVPTATGSYTVRGTSAGTANYNAGTATANFTISKATPSLTLSGSPTNTQTRPGSVELTATLSAGATGTLTFKAGANTIATVALPAHTATFTPAGAGNAYSFIVEYSGDSNYNSVTSTELAYSFTKSEQADVIASDGTVNYGETLDLSTLVSGGSGDGAFSFTVIDGPGEINGTTLTPTGAGEVQITVTKAADNDYNAKSAAFKVTVTPRVITFTVAAVGTQAHTGSPVTPEPEVRDGTTVLTEDMHFTYSYSNNIDAGASATIHVNGIGSYAGSTDSTTFTVGGIVPGITTSPSVSGTVYTETALSQIPLTGGVASASGHFEWVNSSATAVYGSNTFEARFVPYDNILYVQVSGINVTFNAVNRSSGDNDNSNSRNTTIVTAIRPNQPTAVNVNATAQVKNGNATLTITDSMVKAAIDKALADAKANGNTANGISVNISVIATGSTEFALILERAALNRLLESGVTSFSVSSLLVNMSFDTAALKQIQAQSGGNITITVKPATVTGLRNAFNITISSTKDGKAVNITSLGTGTSTLSISVEPGKNEFGGYLYGAYVGTNNQIIRIADSAYDANSRRMIFSTGHFSVYGVGYIAPSARVADISSHWGKEAIDYVVGRGLLSGTSKTTFAPNTAMTRGMLVTALGRLANVAAKAYTTNSFTDVKADSTFRPYIEWARSKGVVQGIGNGQFAPDRAITREEIGVIFSNFTKATGYTLPITREATTYADAPSIGSTYKTAVTAMQQAGIMMSGSGNKFNPKSNATRAEVAAMLHRYIKLTIDPATAQGWAVNDDGQWIYYKDGKTLTGTQTIDGVTYYHNADGTLKTGWVKDGDNWRFYSGNKMLTGWWDIGADGNNKRYYFGTYGNMVSGKWLQIDGKWYYFNADGSLARNTKIGEFEVDENGVRKTK